MPQLLSRMDNIGWLTPSMAEIMDQGAPLPGGDGSIREQMLQIQKELADLETPAKIVNVRSMPSYTLFVTRPDMVGRLGNRRPVTVNEIRRSLAKIAENHKQEWLLGFMPQLNDQEDSIGILLRTESHSPLSMRRMLVRNTYRDHPSTFAYALGNTLEQRLIIDDLASTGNLLVIGSSKSKHHFFRMLLLTFIGMNTPGELRLVFAGNHTDTYKPLLNVSHAVRRLLKSPEDGLRLLQGMVAELERRQQAFEQETVDQINAYNAIVAAQEKPPMPHIIVVLDSLSDDEWHETRDEWMPLVSTILRDSGNAGIHLIITADKLQAPDIPGALEPLFPLKLVMRSAATSEPERIENFHNSLLRFVDAFVVDERRNSVTPVELCTVESAELQKAIEYWMQAAKKRTTETSTEQVSSTTGMTGVLGQKVVQRAAQAQTGQLTQAMPEPSATITQETSQTWSDEMAFDDVDTLSQAQALAAYLGWIGIGPLKDVLGMTTAIALQTIQKLRDLGVVEDDNSKTPRFVRLGEVPEEGIVENEQSGQPD